MISIHAPREGGDMDVDLDTVIQLLFQSTPPARGATMFLRRGPRHFMISIHAPREGGDGYQYEDLRLVVISIHAPREGGDVNN